MRPIKRVYVAGAYSANNVIDIFRNMKKGISLSTEVFLKGFSPFCPWLDYHFVLMAGLDEEVTVEKFYEYSKSWLEVSDAVLLVPGWKNSKGTLAEIELAEKLKIPIYTSLEELLKTKE